MVPVKHVVAACALLLCNAAFARDPMMTNNVQTPEFVSTADPTKKVYRIGDQLEVFTDGLGNFVKDVQPRPCEFSLTSFFGLCGNLELSESVTGLFQDVSAMPLLNDAASVKVGVIRYNMHFGGDLRIPFSLLSSNVTGTLDQAKVNSLKLLDPDQGNLNLKWSYAGRYHLGSFCRFRKTGPNPDRGICSIGINAGFRYLTLDKAEGDDTTSEGAYGGYVELANTFMFPVFQREKADEKDVGQLAIKLFVSRFRHSKSDSGAFFPDAVDQNGDPIALRRSYTGYGVNAHLYITDKLGVEVSRFVASSDTPLSDLTTVSFSYDID